MSTDRNTIAGFTVPLTTPTRPGVSLGCHTCPDLTFPAFPTRNEAQHIAGQRNLIAHGRANIATADPESDAEDRALLARATGGVCIHLDDDTSNECGDWTEEHSRYCPAHTDEAEDAGEETSLDDWGKELDQRDIDRRDGQRINGASPTPAQNTTSGFPDWLAEAVITDLEADAGWITGTTGRGKTDAAALLNLPRREPHIHHPSDTFTIEVLPTTHGTLFAEISGCACGATIGRLERPGRLDPYSGPWETARYTGERHRRDGRRIFELTTQDPPSAAELLNPARPEGTPYAGHCGCCDMRHGRKLAAGEHCSWCRGGLRHRMTWAVRGSIGR